MSDWSMYELEDIVWDEIGENDDHIVPHPASEQGDNSTARGDWHKKPRHEALTSVRKSASSRSVAKDVFEGKEETSFPTLKDRKAPMLDKGSWSHTPDGVFPDFSDTEHIKEVTSLTSNDANMSDNCFKSTEIDSLSNGFCEDDAVLGNKGATIGSSLCRFPLGDISPTDDELKFFGSTHNDKESSDLLYYGWPDIGNFEDVDRMFRSCDSTFGLGDGSNDDEMSWLSSSSHALNDSGDSLKSGFKSSCLELNALNTTSKHCEADTKLMPDLKHPIINSDTKSILDTYRSSQTVDADESAKLGRSSYDNWLNAGAVDNKAKEISERVEVKMSPVQTFSGNNGMIKLQRKQSKHPHQSEGKRKDRSSEYTTDRSFHGDGKMKQIQKLPNSLPSAKKAIPSPTSAQQNQSLQPDSFGYLGTYNPYVNANYNHPALQTPVTQIASSNKSGDDSFTSLSSKASFTSNHTMLTERSSDRSLSSPSMKTEDKMEKLCGQQQVQPNLHNVTRLGDSVEQDAFADQVAFQKQLNQSRDEFGSHNAVEGVSVELPADVDSSNAQESSCMTSVLSDDFSLEATSFRQLQHVTQQLDIRTKLCIRDSLYRLARNAEQRHNFRNLNSSSRDKSGLQTAEESDKCMGFMDFETDTNPIDRSIAHLLFHGPSDPFTKPANDALSLESHTIIHGSIIGQPVMPEKLVYEEESASGDTKLLITDQ